MKRACRVIFVLFYIAASVAVSGYCSVHAAYQFKDAVHSLEIQVKVPRHHLINALPNFGHSKRPRPSICGVSPASVRITKPAAGEIAEQRGIEYLTRVAYQLTNPRAPPV